MIYLEDGPAAGMTVHAEMLRGREIWVAVLPKIPVLPVGEMDTAEKIKPRRAVYRLTDEESRVARFYRWGDEPDPTL